MPDLKIKIHPLHPPPPPKRQRAVQLPDFFSGATERSGRFNEGLLLRRAQELEAENARLRKAVSDLTLDKMILAEAARGNF